MVNKIEATNSSRPDVEPDSLLASVGNTPLIKLRRSVQSITAVEIYAKAEWFNPGGSVKDRPALNMILEGERNGQMRPGKVILDATSGNTGIAYAMIGATRGYKVKLCLPANASPERKHILQGARTGADSASLCFVKDRDGRAIICFRLPFPCKATRLPWRLWWWMIKAAAQP